MNSTVSDISIGFIREPEFGYEEGDILIGRYQVLNQRAGGAGQIYYCIDLQNQSPCVLKAPSIQFQEGRTREDAGLFLEEIKRLVHLPPHGNIIHFYRVEIIQDIYFIVMEWAASSLKEWCMQKISVEIDEILRIAISVCRGMRHCLKWLSKPDKEFVHGDLKPNNILVSIEGEVRIADFGIGGYTKSYASPEQLKKQTPDSRSDIFSLGIIMLELLEQGRQKTPSFDGKEGKLYSIIKKCTEQWPDDRYQTFEDLEIFLEKLYAELTGQKVLEPDVSIDENKWMMARACDLASIGEYKKAYELLTALTDAAREGNSQVLAQGYYNIAEIFRNNRLYEKALEFYDHAARKDWETHSFIWTNKGIVYRNMGSWEDACYCMEQALKIDPYDAPAIENKIDCVIRLHRADELKQILQSLQVLLDKRPDAYGLIKSMAYILYIKKDFKGAIEYYERYLGYRKDDWDAVYYYAISLYVEKDTTKAMEFFRTAVQMMGAGGIDGQTPSKLLYLAISYYNLLDFEKAEQYLELFESQAGPAAQSEKLRQMLHWDNLIGEQYYADLSEAGKQLTTTAWTNNPYRFYTELINNLESQRRQWNKELPDANQSRLVRHMNIVCFSYEAVAYMELERYEEAADTCDKVLFWDYSSPENLYNKGQALSVLGRYEEALVCLLRAQDHQKDLDRLQHITSKIQQVRDKRKEHE